jgi:hypothetical protein
MLVPLHILVGCEHLILGEGDDSETRMSNNSLYLFSISMHTGFFGRLP